MSERVDEWLMGQIQDFEGKSFQSVAKGELDLSALKGEEEDEEETEQDKNLLEKIKKTLSERVEDVRNSVRLTQSPSCIVLNEHDMAMYMQQLMKQAGQEMPTSKPVLEVNTGHPILKRMQEEKDDKRFNEWASLLLDQAVLSEGGQLEDPAAFVRRMNDMMLELSD
jgi:molecular chaperone HtpG